MYENQDTHKKNLSCKNGIKNTCLIFAPCDINMIYMYFHVQLYNAIGKEN